MSQPGAEQDRPGNLEWSVCGASVTGSQHIAKGLGCDDAFAYGVTGHYVVAAVADGAGSVTGTSAWGSHVACQSVVEAAMGAEFIARFYAAGAEDGDAIARWLFDTALEHIVAQAANLGLPVQKMSTTLCIAVARPGLAVFAQIGDGIIAVEDAGGISTLLIEDKSEYANATWFIQSNDAFAQAFRSEVRSDVSAFALSTDGMAYKITNIVTGEAYEPFFKGSWQNVKSNADPADLAALLRGIQDDQTGDDKTLVLAVLDHKEDRFFPSGRPMQRTTVSSPAPPVPPRELPLADPAAGQAQPQPLVDPNVHALAEDASGRRRRSRRSERKAQAEASGAPRRRRRDSAEGQR